MSGQEGRCGYGPRLPLLVISPYAKPNFVDHTTTDQSSVVKFIQSNWSLPPITGSAANFAGALSGMFNFTQTPTPAVFLNPTTGEVSTAPVPLLPDSKTPILFIITGAAVAAAVLLGGGRWRQRKAKRATA